MTADNKLLLYLLIGESITYVFMTRSQSADDINDDAEEGDITEEQLFQGDPNVDYTAGDNQVRTTTNLYIFLLINLYYSYDDHNNQPTSADYFA